MTSSPSSPTISITVEFGGGLELLFSKQRKFTLRLPSHLPAVLDLGVSGDTGLAPTLANGTSVGTGAQEAQSGGGEPFGSAVAGESKSADMAYLIRYLKDNLLKERPELFVEGASVRPGILVLINDTDWELEGEGDYVLKDRDEVVFISTLHGG